MKTVRLMALAASLVLFVQPAFAEELDTIFKKVNEYVAAKNFPKALEELSWAQKEIEKMNGNQVKSFLPDELAGFSGQKLQANNAMGITNVERAYQKDGASERVKVSITNAGKAAGMGGGMAAIGRMAAMMGNQPGMDTFRIQGKTAALEQREGSKRASLSVFLDSGSIVKLESSNLADSSALKQMAEALKLEDIDKYFKGAS